MLPCFVPLKAWPSWPENSIVTFSLKSRMLQRTKQRMNICQSDRMLECALTKEHHSNDLLYGKFSYRIVKSLLFMPIASAVDMYVCVPFQFLAQIHTHQLQMKFIEIEML